ncbi:MAG: PAS domain-containing protein [Sulfitobacter sp.]
MDTLQHPAGWELKNDKAIALAIRHARIPLCISDPTASDNPIVFANDAFFELTGYSPDEVIGHNCRLLQGPDTTPESVASIRAAIGAERLETVEILNYRKDGSTFINALQIGPILDDDGRVVYFFGSQMDVTAKRDAAEKARKLANQELNHRLRNIVNIMTVIIRLSAREETNVKDFGALVSQRLRALGEAHLQTIDLSDTVNVSFKELSAPILAAYAPAGQAQFTLDGPEVTLSTHVLSCAALGLHELATNSVKYGALSCASGQVALTWDLAPDARGQRITFRWQESGGPEVVKPTRRSGSRIVSDLVDSIGGEIALDWQPSGLVVNVSLPL